MNEQEPYEAYEDEEYAEEQQAYAPVYAEEEAEAPYDDPQAAPRREANAPRAQIISTNMTINLTCTLCAGCGLLALFLRFADTRSRAVRRVAVQSAGLTCVMAFLSVGLWVLGLILGWIPLIGRLLTGLLWAVWLALMAGDGYARVQMMLHAYRGEAYVLPFIGEKCRQFE